MATDLREVMDVGAKIANAEHRQVQEMFEILPGQDANLLQMIGYGENVRFNDAMKYEWIVDEYQPHFVTVNNGAGYTAGDTAIVVDEADVIQVGQLLKIGDETARVTGINSATNTLTITRSHGANAAEAMVDNQQLFIMAPGYLDTDSFQTTPTRRGEFKFNHPQQIMYEFAETYMRSASTSYLTRGEDQLVYSEMKHMVEAARRLEQSILYNEKNQPTATQIGTFDGVDALITDNANTSVGILTATKIVNLLADIWDDSGSAMQNTVYLSHNTKRIFDAVLNEQFSRQDGTMTNEIGVTMDRFKWNGGTLDFVISHYVQDGHAFFLDTSKMSVLPADVRLGAGPGWNRGTRNPENTNALKQEEFFWFIGTFAIWEERLHGKFKGIDTTLSSYPGAI